MISRIRKFTVGLLPLTMVLALSAFSVKAIEVITHPSQAETEISDSTLRRIYTMKLRRWPDQQPIQLFVYPSNSPIHNRFTKQVLKMFPYQLDRIWNKLAFSGTGVLPTEVSTQEEMIRLVTTTPGAIGYIQKRGEREVEIVYHASQQ